MFTTEPSHDKALTISDPATGIHLELDTDDVDPEVYAPHSVSRLLRALNNEYHPPSGMHVALVRGDYP